MRFEIIKNLAVVITFVIGLLSLLAPKSIENFIGLQAIGGRGSTEIRTIFGALFIGLALAVYLLRQSSSYQFLGIVYLAMAVVRLVFIFIDRSSTPSNWISFVSEAVFGIFLIL